MRAVLVERDHEDRAMFEELVTGLGHHIRTFDGPEFCRAYRNGEDTCPLDSPCFDVIILNNLFDTRMTGLEFIECLDACDCRIDRANRAVVAAGWPPSEIETAERLGVQMFTKPFLVKDLVEWIYRLKKLVPNPS